MNSVSYPMQVFLFIAVSWLVLAALAAFFGFAQKSGERLASWLFPYKDKEDRFEVQWAIAFNELSSDHGAGLWEDESWGRPLTQPQREQLTRWLEASTKKAIERYVAMRSGQRKN
jgi:hypothetical protein